VAHQKAGRPATSINGFGWLWPPLAKRDPRPAIGITKASSVVLTL
jgi:hypothetical protein